MLLVGVGASYPHLALIFFLVAQRGTLRNTLNDLDTHPIQLTYGALYWPVSSSPWKLLRFSPISVFPFQTFPWILFKPLIYLYWWHVPTTYPNGASAASQCSDSFHYCIISIFYLSPKTSMVHSKKGSIESTNYSLLPFFIGAWVLLSMRLWTTCFLFLSCHHPTFFTPIYTMSKHSET